MTSDGKLRPAARSLLRMLFVASQEEHSHRASKRANVLEEISVSSAKSSPMSETSSILSPGTAATTKAFNGLAGQRSADPRVGNDVYSVRSHARAARPGRALPLRSATTASATRTGPASTSRST